MLLAYWLPVASFGWWFFHRVRIPSNKCCVQDLIPGIGKAGEAPVAAVHARVISAVSGWMRVLSELGEQGYVEQIDRLRHGPEDAVDDALSWKWTAWVRRSSDRLRLFVTVLCILLSPVGSSDSMIKRRTQSDQMKENRGEWFVMLQSLLVMGWGDALEEDFGGSRVDVGVHPLGPRRQPLVEGHQSIHVSVHLISILYVVPSAPAHKIAVVRRRGEERFCIVVSTRTETETETGRISHGWLLPL